MSRLKRFWWMGAVLLVSFASHAGDIDIGGAWSRATAPGQDVAGVDLSITSKQTARLVGMSSPAATAVELHGMTHENGMMKMNEVKSLELPAGKRVNLGEGGYHLMMSGLKSPLQAGTSVPLTLSFKIGSKPVVQVETRIEVRPLNAAR